MTRPRVLVVDDNPVTGIALQEILAERGFDAEWAANGEAALARLGVLSYHALLIDHYMPGIEGVDVIRQVRADERTKDLPCVLMTAADGEHAEAIRLYLKATSGPNRLIHKPFEMDELVNVLNEIRENQT